MKIPTRFFPSKKFKFSAPALGVLASIATIISIGPVLFPTDPSNPEIVGQWESDYSYPITNGTMRIQGVTNYLHKGKYNVAGTMTIEGHIDQKAFKFTYSTTGAGTWTADTKQLSITLTSLKTIAKSLSLDGVDIPPALVSKMTGQPVPTLNDAYPEGMSNEFALQKVAQNTLVLGARDPFGSPFTIELHRRLASSDGRTN